MAANARRPWRGVLRPWSWAVLIPWMACSAGDPASGALSGMVEEHRGQSVLVLLGSAQANQAQRDVEAATADTLEAALEARQAAWERLRGQLRESLPPGVREGHSYSHLPLVHLHLPDAAALARVQALPGVVRVDADVAVEAHLAQSLPLVSQPTVAALGLDGAGATVAVLDTGVDYTRAAFGSCVAPGGDCKVVVAQDFAPEDGQKDASGHGTNVAGIVLGVAAGARIAALDVFNGASGYSSDIIAAINWCVANRTQHNIVAINMSLGGGSSTTTCPQDVFAAPLQAARTAGILAAVSSGNGALLDRIASPACTPAAISVGAVFDSNIGAYGGSCQDLVTAADKVTCFSNSAPFLSILAPGAMVSAAGYTYAGTSQAAPHVAGALAVLRAAYPSETAEQTASRLLNSGTPVVDARVGRTYPRLNLADAVSGCFVTLSPSAPVLPWDGGSTNVVVNAPAGCAWHATVGVPWASVTPVDGNGSGTITLTATRNSGAVRTGQLTVEGRQVTFSQGVDTAAPVGTVAVAGSPTYVRATAVSLVLSAADGTGVATACVSNTATCTTFTTYAATRSWTLPAGDGVKTVRAWFRDTLGNTSTTPASTTVTLDATRPVDGTLTVTAGDAQNALQWTQASDATSGLAGYVLKMVVGTTLPATGCTSGTTVFTGSGTSWTHAGLTNGTRYSYRLCALDGAGNTSVGVTGAASPLPERDPPTGSVQVQGQPTWVKTAAVTVLLTATDASTVTHVCLSNTSSCTAWRAFAPSLTWSLSSGSGTKTVYAWFRDVWGNASSTPAQASVGLDVTAPVVPTLTATGADGRVDLAWSTTTDAHSGFAAFTLLGGATVPSSCTSGTVLYQGTATTFAHQGLTNGALWNYRLCSADNAGNTALGVNVTARPRPEQTPPTGSVTIAAGATWTRTAAVSLTLQAADGGTTVARMCISNSNSTCTSWVAYATTRSWTLASGDGTKTVYVWFEDAWGNAMTSPASDTISMDTRAPPVPVVTASSTGGAVTLTWPAVVDTGSGLQGYSVRWASGGVAPANCSAGTQLYTGAQRTFVHSGLVVGTTQSYRVCAQDVAGNTSISAGVIKVVQ